MSRIAYVNGRYIPHRDASVHIDDRGYQFADGVYEVIAVERGRLVDEGLHVRRLERSLAELKIAEPMPETALKAVMREVLRRNRVRDGIIYIQMTRGVAPRDHAFPRDTRTQVVMTARRAKPANPRTAEEGTRVITVPDQRWARCDIKSIALLQNILGKQQAREAFLTSTTAYVTPVVRIDDSTVADGKPGPLARELRTFYLRYVEAGAQDA